jgi:DNA-binding response OmpR family regulator
LAKILVADDETPIALLLENFLSSQGHQVVSARSSLGALGWLDQEQFDLAIMDVLMPGPLNGLDVCRIAKSDPRSAGTRVLIATGLPGMEDQAMLAGADRFIPKPFLLDELNLEVVLLLKRTPCGPGSIEAGSLRGAIETYHTLKRGVDQLIG